MGRIGIFISAFIAFAFGLVTLLSLLLGGDASLFGDSAGALILADMLALPAAVLSRLVAIFAGFALIIGIGNLLLTHGGRALRGAFYSIVLLLSFAGTIAWYMVQPGDATLLEAVQVPIESALAALLFVSLLRGGARILSKRADIWGVVFVAALLIVLLGTLPLPALAPLREWSDWLLAVPVSAGARAILLGIALGTVVTGVRVLLGQDRAYRG